MTIRLKGSYRAVGNGLPTVPWKCYLFAMPTVEEIEKLAEQLSDAEKGVLISHLLASLPPILREDDEGLQEAMRRDAELGDDPNAGIPLEEFEKKIRQRRGR